MKLGTLITLILIVVGPLATIFTFNHLFGLTLTYDIKTWFAVGWFGGLVYGALSAGASS